ASAVQPSLPAIDRIAAHCDAWTSACSQTIRTARSRNSGAYRVPVDIGSILSRKEPSDKPGAIQDHASSTALLTLHLSGMWVAFAAATGLIAYFVGRVSESLAERERELT